MAFFDYVIKLIGLILIKACGGVAGIPKQFQQDELKEEPEIEMEMEMAGEDRISELTDDILILIVSRLPLKQAVLTSILSTRWRHLYNYITRFDICFRIRSNETRDMQLVEEEKLFLNRLQCISRVLDRHRSSQVLEVFKMRLPPFRGVKVDRWFEFAMSKGVEILDIERDLYIGIFPVQLHTFPVESLIQKYGLALRGLKTLRTLCLSGVDVDDRGVELLLSNCDVLEHLSILNSYALRNLAVVGPRPLKHLVLMNIYNIESIEIRNTNLVSFTYIARKAKLILENLPDLIEINTLDFMIETYLRPSPNRSCNICRPAKLELTFFPSEDYDWLEQIGRHRLPSMLSHLKHLEVTLPFHGPRRLMLPLAHLIDASPLLQQFVVKFDRCKHLPEELIEKVKIENIDRSLEEHPHYNLRWVKFYGYSGHQSEVELALYILKNAVKLEQFIIKITLRISKTRTRQQTIAHAWQQLRGRIPESVHLVVF